MTPERLALVEALLVRGREHDSSEPEHDRRYRNVDQATAELMHLLIRSLRPSSVLEIGTSNGCSTIWLADGLDDRARMVSVESDQRRHGEAIDNLAAARLDDRVDLVLGDARQVLEKTRSQSVDFVFLDADRRAYADYWPDLLRILRPGGLLAVDNCISHAAEVAEFISLVRETPGTETVLVPVGAGLLLATSGP
ncbi:O-methyltransferase [Actinomyces sp. ZJ308]|uniref:O-methyltransferase n=1 Tax=Actinomyces sp. ZJ308 TaxID=2708342 RepID=UPI00141FD2C7|nr:O-methyltransferase [Actinomyces sp. ZJ308]